MSAARACLRPDEALAYVTGAGSSTTQGRAVDRHLAECADCRGWIAELARTSLVEPRDDDDDGMVPIGEYLPEGTPVGRYVLGARLGAGGMGVVYEATDPKLGRKVAIKVLRSALADVAKTRLVDEARAMAQLSHRNVRAVYDIGEVEGRIYLALELVDAPTLDAWLSAAPRTVAQIVAVFAAAARGLAAAHAAGIVHRDFKPSNVFVDAEGRTVVSDFGLALLDGETTMGDSGTPRYMAPEQLDGKGDMRVDQYSLGVSLREALQVRRVPARVRRVVQRTTAADPDDRFGSIADVARALESRSQARGWVLGLVPVALAAAVATVAVPARSEPLAVTAAVPDPDAHRALDPEIRGLLEQAFFTIRKGDFEGGKALAEQALALATTRGSDVDRAGALLLRSRAYSGMGDPQSAQADQEQAYLLATEAGRPDIAANAASDRLVTLSHELGQHDTAIEWGRHARAAMDRYETTDWDRATFDVALAQVLADRQDWDEARKQITPAVEIYREQTEAHRRFAIVSSLNARGHYALEAGDTEGSLADLLEARALAEERMGRDDPQYGQIEVNLGNTYRKLGRADESIELYRHAIEVFEAKHGPKDRLIGFTLLNLGGTLVELDRPQEAVDAFLRAQAILDPEHPASQKVAAGLGTAWQKLGEHAEAYAAFSDAIERTERIFGANDPAVPGLIVLQGECSLAMGDSRAAASAARRALDLTEDEAAEPAVKARALLQRATAAQ